MGVIHENSAGYILLKWYHIPCFITSQVTFSITTTSQLEGFELLPATDQKEIITKFQIYIKTKVVQAILPEKMKSNRPDNNAPSPSRFMPLEKVNNHSS